MTSTLAQPAKWDGTLIEKISRISAPRTRRPEGKPFAAALFGAGRGRRYVMSYLRAEFASSIHNVYIATLPQVFEARLPTLAAIAGANSEAPFQLSGAKKGRI
jgi:hypothetical protein